MHRFQDKFTFTMSVKLNLFSIVPSVLSTVFLLTLGKVSKIPKAHIKHQNPTTSKGKRKPPISYRKTPITGPKLCVNIFKKIFINVCYRSFNYQVCIQVQKTFHSKQLLWKLCQEILSLIWKHLKPKLQQKLYHLKICMKMIKLSLD